MSTRHLSGIVVLSLAAIAGLLTLSACLAPPSISQTTSAGISICAIQGEGLSSRYNGAIVKTSGIVTYDIDDTWQKGFYLQKPNCDQNANTSDGIYVYLGVRQNIVTQGDMVEVSGVVDEYFGFTEIQVAPANVTILSKNNPLPQAVDLNPPSNDQAARQYLETREGMVVQAENAVVVGPTDGNGRTWLVHSELGIERVFHGDPTGEILCVGDDGQYRIKPGAKVQDRIAGLTGVLDFRGGLFCMQLIEEPIRLAGKSLHTGYPEASISSGNSVLSLATFNLGNLFDTEDDPETEDTILNGTEYQRKLLKLALVIHEDLAEPDIIAVQEAENLSVLNALANRPEISTDYAVVISNTIDQRGLDVGLLYRPSRVEVLEYETYQGCTTLVDGLDPDGNGDVENPENDKTCDTNADGVLDGNRLFSRQPLAVHLRLCTETCPSEDDHAPEIWLITGHFKSKIEDSDEIQYTKPRRTEQAKFIAQLGQRLEARSPGATIIIAGDLNDFPSSEPLQSLVQEGYLNLMVQAQKATAYTYNFQGVSQILDHVLVFPSQGIMPTALTIHHINADYPADLAGDNQTRLRSSDHDPISIQILFSQNFTFLPSISNQ